MRYDAIKSRWPEELTIRFVELYKSHECLWNVHSPEYKDREFKRMALVNIAENMGIIGFGVNEIRQKIKNLRSTYSQEITKIKKAQEMGGGHSYYPNIKWFETMNEIMNHNRNYSVEQIKVR